MTVEEYLRDPQVQARQAAATKRMADRFDEYKRDAAGVLEDLRKAGFDVESVGDLRNTAPYPSAVPVLIAWLPKIDNQYVKEDIIRRLSVPWARPHALRPILQEFKTLPDKPPALKWAAGNALEVIADDSVFEEIVEIAIDPRHGRARDMVVASLGNMTDPRAVEILGDLLDDEAVAPYAVMGLGKLQVREARDRIEPFLTHPEEWIRAEAKKALAKIDSAPPPSSFLYTKTDGELLVVDQREEKVIFSGKVLDHPVDTVLPVAGSDDAIVLVDYDGGPRRFKNLLRINPRGEPVWIADLPVPSETDAYVQVQWDELGLTANSWSGYWVVLDPGSGKIEHVEFVK